MTSNLHPGEHCGEYELLTFIGRGGMAQVWSARCLKTGEVVAIKTLLPLYAGNAVLQERLAREGQSQRQLQHPNILRAHGVFQWKGSCFMVMDLVDGESLERYILRRRFMPVPEVRGVARAVLSALAHAHQNNIVHRDVKPSNILLSRQGRILLGDFGIALLQNASRLTRLGSMGTPSFMSPEQIVGKHIDHLSDIYSVGCVLYELLAGVPPFQAEGSEANDIIRNAHQFHAPEPLIPKNPDVTPALEHAVLRALEKNPKARFQSCAELAAALGVSIQVRNQENEGPGATDHIVAGFSGPAASMPGMAGPRATPLTPARAGLYAVAPRDVGGSREVVAPRDIVAPRAGTPAGALSDSGPNDRTPQSRVHGHTGSQGMTIARPSEASEPPRIRGWAERLNFLTRRPALAGTVAIAIALLLAGLAASRWKSANASVPEPTALSQSNNSAAPVSAPAETPKTAEVKNEIKTPAAETTDVAPLVNGADTPLSEPARTPGPIEQFRRAYDSLQNDAAADVMRERHPPPLGPRPGAATRTAGVMQWVGTRGDSIEIDGNSASSGALSGDPLPGIPVRVWLEGENGSLIALPAEADGYKRLVLRTVNGRARIHWKALGAAPNK